MKLGIYRIIGNEIFPRDKKGDRLNVIKSILDIEPDFYNCKKIWVLNIINNPKYKFEIQDFLNKHNQNVIDIPFEKKRFQKMSNEKKLFYILSINSARNAAIKLGKNEFDYTILLDGDCFFQQSQWNEFEQKLKQVQQSKHIKIFSFPIIRVQFKNGKIWKTNNFREEPQLAFCSTSSIVFDEAKEYGNGDKVSLLNSLGFKRLSSRSNYYYPTEDFCEEMVEVCHLSNSYILYDKFSELRKIGRKIAIMVLKQKIYFGKYCA